MMYLLWILFAPISLLFNIFCMITSPLWALWAAVFKLTELPGPFSWVHTHDDWIYGFYEKKPNPPEKFSDRFKSACKWICRNPGYGFDAKVLGFSGEGLEVIKRVQEGEFDRGENAYRYDILRNKDGRKFFSYRRDFRFTKKKYIKLWIGWQYRTQAGYHIIKVDFNPFKTVRK